MEVHNTVQEAVIKTICNRKKKKTFAKGRNAKSDQMKEGNFLKSYFQAVYPTYFQMVQDKTRNINVEKVKN